jgi:pimeloyl-ACP methyl ester carboxylesterase
MLFSNRAGYVVGRWVPWFFWRWLFLLFYADVHRHPEKLATTNKHEPAADQAIFAQPGVREIFTRNFAEAFRQGTDGPAWDGWLLSHPWGFPLGEISVPVYVWQGEADVVVTPAMGRAIAERIPTCHAKFLPDEGHLLFLKYWADILAILCG